MAGFWRAVLTSAAAAAVLGVIGLVSAAVREPFLVPSLGSAAAVQLLAPRDPSARIWNTLVGQLLGIVGGLVGVLVAAGTALPPFTGGHALALGRVAAVTAGVFVTALLQLAFRAVNPAGAALAVFVATGALAADAAGGLILLAGAVLVTILGEVLRRAVLA